MKNRVLAVFMAAAMVLSGFSATAFAENRPEGSPEEEARQEGISEEIITEAEEDIRADGIAVKEASPDNPILAAELLPEKEYLLTEYDSSCGSWQIINEEGTAYRDPFRFFYVPDFNAGDRIGITTSSGTFAYVLSSTGEEFSTFVPEDPEGAPFASLEAALIFADAQDDRQFLAGDTVGLQLRLGDGQVFGQTAAAGIADNPDLAVIDDILYRRSEDGTSACAYMPVRALSGDVVIPDKAVFPDGGSCPVTSVEGSGFCYDPGLNGGKMMASVTLPETVAGIGEGLGYYQVTADECQPIPGFVICGTAGTYAQTYAEACGFAFVEQAGTSVEEESEEDGTESVPFDQTMAIGDVSVTVKAAAGVFPADAVLSVEQVPAEVAEKAEEAVNAVREDGTRTGLSYTFDIKVLDGEGNERQPDEGQKAEVSFGLAPVADANLEASVYHIAGKDGESSGELTAEALDAKVNETEETVKVEAEGFSLYTVEFTYQEMEYVLVGDETVKLSAILEAVGLTGEAEAAETSNKELLAVSRESGEWTVTALQAFDTTEWMKVTISGVVYEITVTDDRELGSGQDLWKALQDRIDAAPYGEVIKLSDDVINTNGHERITVDKMLTIDLNGHKLDRNRSSQGASGHVIEVLSGGMLTITDNSPDQSGIITGGYSMGGGGIFVNAGATLLFSGGTITGNKAGKQGGGIYADGTVYMSGGYVTGNTAHDIGGGIYSQGMLNITGGAVTGNTSLGSGGGIYVDHTSWISLSDADISGNSASKTGGGLQLHSGSDGSIEDCTIIGNHADGSGGGLYMDEEGSLLTIDGTHINENSSGDEGGGIYLYRGSIEMNNSREMEGILDNNKAANGGGVAVPDKTTFTATGITISNNNAEKGSGGGVFNNGTVSLTRCTVSRNGAKMHGGGMFNDIPFLKQGAASLTLENCTVSDNRSDGTGGGIFSGKKLKITDGSITGNFGGEGGHGIYITDKSDLTMIGGALAAENNGTEVSRQDVLLAKDQKLGFSEPLTDGAHIGITMEEFSIIDLDIGGNGIFTTGYSDINGATEPSDYFFSPDGYDIAFDVSRKEAQVVSSWKGLQGEIDAAADAGRPLTLSHDYIADSSCDRLKIRKSVTINLNGYKLDRNLSHYKTDGRIFEVYDGAKLTIRDESADKSGKITGGNAGNGGGIYVHEGASLLMESGTVSGNTAEDDGGGIYSEGTVEIKGGTISGNTAGGNGGGIFSAHGSRISLSDAAISGNTANEGGGMYLHLKTDAAVMDCTIDKNNHAGKNGGGLLWDAEGCALTITGTTIDGNSAGTAGGGVYLREGTIEMGDSQQAASTLTGNKADNGGGAKITKGTFFTAVNVSVLDNKAEDGEGGGVKNYGTTVLTNCIISGNSATKEGGGAYTDNDGKSAGDLTLDRCTITNNSSKSNGGGIYADKTLWIIGGKAEDEQKCAFSGNTAQGSGGGIYVDKDSEDVYIMGRIEVKNNTASFGSDLYLRKNRKLALNGAITGTGIGRIDMEELGVFTWQYSVYHAGTDPDSFFCTDEGAMPVAWYADTEAQLESDWPQLQQRITDAAASGTPVDIDKDYTAGSGDDPLRIPENKSVTINLNGFTLNRHRSSKDSNGHVIEVLSQAVLTVKDQSAGQAGVLTGGWADHGGGIYIHEGATLNFEAGSITGSRAGDQGGGIFVHEGATLNFSGGTVSGNKSDKQGGGIYVDGTLNMTDSAIDGNTAGDDGGGIYVSKTGQIDLKNSAITNNNANSGAGINMLLKADASVQGGKITGNAAKEYGGGLRLDGENRTLTITGTEISDNSAADDGGGVYLKNGSIIMDGGSLSGNVASYSGGGAKVASGTTFTADGTEISSNQAASKEGGGIKSDGMTTLTNCTVSGNTAVEKGGGIKSDGMTTLVNCIVSGNTSDSYGGGVCSNNRLTVNNGSFTGNTAKKGGGIYVSGDAGTTGIQGDIMVYGNTSTVFGDNVFLPAGKVLTLTGELTGNTTIGVDLEKSTGVFTKDYSTYNTAEPSGFFAVTDGYWIVLSDGEAEIKNNWSELKSMVENAESGAVITLNKNYAAAASDDRIIVPKGREITIDLNGRTVNRNRAESDADGHVFEVLGTLNLIDGSERRTGTVTGGWADHGGGINVGGSGTLNMAGGTVTGNRAVEGGGGIYVHGILTMTDGVVRDNKSDGRAGGIGLDGNSTLNLHGGTVTGNKSEKRGGGIAAEKGAKFCLQGNPVVQANDAAVSGNDVYLPSGSRLALTGGLVEGARLGIAIEDDLGEFTSEYSNYMGDQDPAGYFVSTQGYQVYYEEHREAALKIDSHGETDHEKPFIDMGDQVNTDTTTLGSQNWMSGISGERYLNEINMPGTHDSAMCNIQKIPEYIRDWTSTVGIFVYPVGAYYAKTQVKYINHQLEEGARQLDIRLNDCYKKEEWYGYVWADDGRNLWLSHGTDAGGGNYLATDANDNFLSFYQVLDWVKDFLKNHPTETVILNIRPQTTQSGHTGIIRQRTRKNLEASALEINPSTGEPYLYKESGSDSYFAPYTHMPQLKDCRGKIVIMPDSGGFVDVIGGFLGDSFVKYTDPTHYDLTYIEKVAEEEKAYREMNGDGSVKIPTDADTNCDFLWYWELNSTGEDQGMVENYTSFVNPVKIAEYVNPRLIGEGKPFGQEPMGLYLGWVRLDGFRAEYAEAIWRTNFPDLQYCTVTVQSGLGDSYPDQVYKVLKGTMLTIPGNIYKQLPQNQYIGSWKTGTGVVCRPNDKFKVEEDVTFTAQWLEAGEVPVRVIWKDAGDADKLRPSTHSLDLTVTAANGGQTTVTVTENEHWEGVASGDIKTIVPHWGRIAITDENPLGQDKEGQYRYEEVFEDGIGYTFTIVHTPQYTVNAAGKVGWDDVDNADGLRPASVTLRLVANGTEEASVIATENGGWQYDFTKLPQYEGGIPQYRDGELIEYSLDEEYVAEYSALVDGYSVTYRHTASTVDTAQVLGSMEWDDVDNLLEHRPEKVLVTLLANGSEYDSKEITAGEIGLWEFGFDQVPVCDDNGNTISYSISVGEIPKYTTVVEDITPGQDDTASGEGKPTVYAFRATNTLIVDDKDKRPAEVEEVPKPLSLTYSGGEQILVREGRDSGGTMLYALGADDTAAPSPESFSEDLPAGTDAGTYYVWYYVKGDLLHTDTKPASIAAEIGKLPVTFTGKSETKAYTGSETEITDLTEEGLIAGHTHNVAFSARGTDVGDYEGTITAKDGVVIKAGETDVTGNYDISVVNGMLTIEQDPELTFTVTLESKTYAYDGEPHALPAEASSDAASGVTSYEYSRDGEAWTSDLSTLTATDVADSCTILVRASNPNYTNAAEGSAELIIEQDPELKLTVTLNGRNYTYNGKPHALPTAAVTNAASGTTAIEYSRDGETWTPDLPALTAVDVADSCTILVRAANPNYADIAEGSAELTIKRRRADITVDDASKVRGESDPSFTGTVEGLVADGDLGEVKFGRSNTAEAAGVYEGVLTASYKKNPNYRVVVTKGDFTIRELYTVIWLDGDSTELQTKTYAEGDPVPVYDGKEPTKTATAQYSYKFSAWDEGSTSGTTTTYRPVFSETVNKYTVKFINYDGTELQSGKVAYGEMPAYTGKTPVREAPDEWHTYRFARWDPEVKEVTGNAVYTAAFELEVTDPAVIFVIRLYNVCLDRDPDEEGLTYWVTRLTNGEITGVKAAQGFVFSQEFQNRNFCNRHFVEQLYRAFIGREYDEAGRAYWIDRLETGSTREAVFNGFALSAEFTQLCRDYGIERGDAIGVGKWGTVPHGPCTMVENGVVCGEEDGVTAFVRRLYNVALDREAEPEGLADWTNQLWNHTNTGKGVAKGFIFSAEFTNRSLSNLQFVECMYRTFFDRAGDAAGIANWVGQLNRGTSRLTVFNGFADSQEFANLCLKYGILAN